MVESGDGQTSSDDAGDGGAHGAATSAGSLMVSMPDIILHVQDNRRMNAYLGPELASIKQTLQNVQQHTYSTQSSIRNQSHHSWASIVRNAPLLTHTISSYGSSSTAPATPSELSKDREVIVKLRDVGTQKTYRKKSSAEIKDKTENARKKAAIAISAFSLARARFVSARQLRSEDLNLALRTAAEAETARIYDKWADFMSNGATLRRPTWGVIVYSIPIKSIQDLSDQGEQDRVTSELLDENKEVWNQKPDIRRVTWLTYPSNYKNQKSSALIVEFSGPRHANEAIMKGTIWASDNRMTVLYDRNARIRRYFKCQQYEHIGIGRKCAGCGEAHAAWSRACMRYVAEQERVQAAAQYRQPLHRIPPYLQDHSSVGSDTETSSPPNSEGRAAGSEGRRKRLTRSTSRPTEQNRSTVRFQERSTLLYSLQELVPVQHKEALIDLNPEIDVDPIPSESEPSIAQQIDMINEPETPAPVTPAPRGRTLTSTSDTFSDNAVTAFLKSPEAPLVPAPTPSEHSTTIVLAEDNTPGRSFLRDPAVLEADLIFVQEPWENPYQNTTYHPANGSHQLLYPDSTEIGDERARELKLTDADGQQVRIFNIYNRPDEVDSTTLDLVISLIIFAGPINSSTNSRLLLLGDFNLHHPAWGGERSKRDSSSDQLLELIDTRFLDLWLEPGTTTWERNGNKTTIDLVFGSQDLTPRLVTCEVNERNHADSDHYPIRTLLDISTKTPEAQQRRNWKACSIKDLQSFVDLNLQSKAFPLQIKQHIELAIEYFIETINQGIAASTPWAKPSKWANPSFNAECREMVKITRKFRHKYTESVITNGPTDPTTGLRETRGSLIPTLKTDDGLAETAEQKVEAFRKAFFSESPLADLSDIPTARIPPQIDFPDLTEHKVLRCIRRAPPDKAPGPDGIPNKV
ncbi:uncharacterized protein KD926_005005 [Aspergillus affinis]|uniref:uncharacterized protein n=1 Tax=Aspergillus affinis TaxID=1070780 RepID=UPI0022FE1C17|nr:uncharacterized protein KD926_005005 [Aspergillus affinis]KAI9034942.1 hypothetical protein KD926_005005 [Aspergillus affinis]